MSKKSNAGMIAGKIVIDVKDWVETYQQLELDVTTEDAIVNLALNGMKPKEAGKIIVVAGERGDLPDYPGSKKLLNNGGATLYNATIGKVKRQIKLQNGKQYEGRAYVAPVKDDEGTEDDDQPPCDTQTSYVKSSVPVQNWLDEKVVESSDPAAVDRAIKYLLKQVTGNIWGRLLIIAEHDPAQIEQVADELKDKIDEMVERLS